MYRSRWSPVGGYLRSSLWVVPLVAIPLGMIATRILHWLDGQLAWAFSGLAVTGARALLDAVITSSLSFRVFTFGSLLWIPYHRLARASGENRAPAQACIQTTAAAYNVRPAPGRVHCVRALRRPRGRWRASCRCRAGRRDVRHGARRGRWRAGPILQDLRARSLRAI